MGSFYRSLICIALWLGLVVFVIGLVGVLTHSLIVGLTPGGYLRGAQTLFLVAVAAYCASKTAQSA